MGHAASSSHPLVRVEERSSGVAVILLGGVDERTVILTKERIEALRGAIAQVRDLKPKGVIFLGPHDQMFTVGADISVIRDVVDPLVGEQLAQVGQAAYSEIESLPFPTIAAISGPCVGGGLELALACHHRICSEHSSTILGLPEVLLGIIPGFGGTQRLPRLIGIQKALSLILTGQKVRAREALALGLVDEVVPVVRLLDRAENILVGVPLAPRPPLSLRDRCLTYTSIGRKLVAKTSRKQILLQTKGFYPAPLKCLDAVLYGLKFGLVLGLVREAKLLGEVVVTPECKALTHVYLLTEAAKKLGKPLLDSLGEVRALVVGAGTMGAGIASVLLQQKIPVVLRDPEESILHKARNHIENGLERRKSLAPAEKRAMLDLLFLQRGGDDRLREVNLVVEAVTEKADVKTAILTELAAKVEEGALIASNTSSLSITTLSEALPNPQSMVGMHFFNPVEKMPLVEIIRGANTSDRSLLTTAALAVKLGKFPIIVNDVPGFLVNRVLTPYLNAASRLLVQGIDPAAIEDASVCFGFPMGPFRVLDEVGLDVAMYVGETMVKGYGERMTPAPGPKELVALGRLGKKNGKGFYDYSGSEPVLWSELVATIAPTARPQRVHKELIADCLVLSMINEAVRCLDEGVAGAPSREAASQIDLGMVMGTGFPPFRGGPLFYADSLGVRGVLQLSNQINAAFNNILPLWEGVTKRMDAMKTFSEALSA